MKRVILWLMILLLCQSVFANFQHRSFISASQSYEVGNYNQGLMVLNNIEPNDRDNPEYALLTGKLLLAIGDYKNAYSWLQKYSTSYLGSDPIVSPQLMRKIYQASIIQDKSTVAVSLGRLAGNINSHDSEYSPIIVENGKTMIFGSNRRSVFGRENIFISSLQNQRWSEPVEIKELCTDRNETVGSISKDGRTLYISGLYDSKENTSSIFKSTIENGTWKKPQIINEVSSSYNDIQPFVYEDKVMFFASNRHGDHKSYDIFVSEFINGSWRPAVNLGNVINTPFDEQTPFLAPDGKTLYFSSNGHLGFGAFDIFRSTRIGNGWTQWTEPENLGPIINSHRDERSFFIAPDGINAYLSSNRFDGVGLEDIYSLDLGMFDLLHQKADEIIAEMEKVVEPSAVSATGDYSIVGLVVDQENNPLAVDIIWTYSLDGVTFMQIVESQADGSFGFGLPERIQNLAYEINAVGYRRTSATIDLGAERRSIYAKIICLADTDGTAEGLSRYISVTGKIVDESSNPVATNVRWSYVYDETMNDIIIETTKQGTFRFYVPRTDRVRYRIEDPKYAVREEMIILPADTNAYDITIRLVTIANEIKISGVVKDNEGNPITANMYWTYKMGDETITYRGLSETNGTYSISLPSLPMVDYRLEKVNFMPVSGSTDLAQNQRFVTMNFTMTKLAEREVFKIDNVQFEFGKAVLLPESYRILDPLVGMMKANPSLTIELSGHTDNIGSKEINVRLSGQRAQAVADYLISKDVDKNRISVIGHGFDKPIATNSTPEGRALNRRVEMTIIGIEYMDDAYDGISESFKTQDGTTHVMRPVQPAPVAGTTQTGILPAATEENFKNMVQSLMGTQRGNLRISMFLDNGKVQSVKVDIMSGQFTEGTIDQISDLLIGWKVAVANRFMHVMNVQK